MRLCVRVAMLFAVGMSLAGCGTTREPLVVITPSYSYVQDDLARGVESYTPTRHIAASTISKLPPLPSVPLFDPLVYRSPDQPFE